MPYPGKIEGLRLPEGLGVRNDCGVYEEAEVPIYYDPMIAKLIVWGESRRSDPADVLRAARISSAGHKDQYLFSPVDPAAPSFHVRELQHGVHR